MGFWTRTKWRLRNLFRPRGADKVVQILQGLATIDERLDERELAFIRAFASRWGFDLDDAPHDHGRSHPVEAPSFTFLRDAMLDYLATGPAADQAHQLRDVFTSLVTIDGRICEREELMLEELGSMIDDFVGIDQSGGYTVFIAPREGAEGTAGIEPRLPSENPTSDVPSSAAERDPANASSVVGEYHTLAYARLVSGWYSDAGYLVTVEPTHRDY